MKKLKTNLDVKRRHFLKTVAASGINAKALSASSLGLSLMANRAFGQTDSAIKRVVFVYVPDGAPPGTYTYKEGVLGKTAKPLEEVKDDIIIFEGCASNVGGHGSTPKLLGKGKTTLDIMLETTDVGKTTPIPSIQLGVETNTGQGYLSKRGNTEVVYNDNPQNAFNRLFGGEVDTSPVGAQRFKSVLDQNRAELAAIKAKLNNAELERLQKHEAAIERVEKNFNDAQVIPEGCDKPEQDSHNWQGSEKGEFSKVARMQADTIALAFKCGLTNIACYQLGTHQAEHSITTGELNYMKDYHQSIHSGTLDDYSECRSFLTEQFAYLIKTLKETNDQNGVSLLQSTIVLQVTDMGNGNAHDNVNCPFTMAGGNSIINAGRNMTGANNNQLLDTVSVALGVQDEVENFADGNAVATILK